MTELVADCPRCGERQMTFAVDAVHHLEHPDFHEGFCICHSCRRSTVFVLSGQREEIVRMLHTQLDDHSVTIEGPIRPLSLTDVPLPAHLPENIRSVFNEGVSCFTMQCFHAAAVMFRLCLHLVAQDIISRKKEGENNFLQSPSMDTAFEASEIADFLDFTAELLRQVYSEPLEAFSFATQPPQEYHEEVNL